MTRHTEISEHDWYPWLMECCSSGDHLTNTFTDTCISQFFKYFVWLLGVEVKIKYVFCLWNHILTSFEITHIWKTLVPAGEGLASREFQITSFQWEIEFVIKQNKIPDFNDACNYRPRRLIGIGNHVIAGCSTCKMCCHEPGWGPSFLLGDYDYPSPHGWYSLK